MKIVIYPITDTTDTTEYTVLKNLRYAPSADVIATEVAIDEFEVDIKTTDEIAVGMCAELRDDDKLWFYGRVTYSEEGYASMRHIIVQSELLFLERFMMPAKMYTGQTAKSAIQEVFANTGATVLFDEDAVSGKTVRGFCDKQSRRNRLQHILFACGLYITSSFVQHPTVLALDTVTVTEIPLKSTYWRPSLNWKEWVTRVNIMTYSFEVVSGDTSGETVTDGTTTWLVTKTNVSLANPSVPAIAPTNEVHVEDVMLMNSNNVSAALSMLGLYYFKRLEVDFDAVNNGEHLVGQKVFMHLSDEELATGYIESLDYNFGTQAKSKITLGACEVIPSAVLTIVYSAPELNMVVGKRTYRLPIRYQYEIDNEYIDITIQGHEYILRPATAKVSGTLTQATSVTVNCYKALDMDLNERILDIISVDEVNVVTETEDGETIYIAEIE